MRLRKGCLTKLNSVRRHYRPSGWMKRSGTLQEDMTKSTKSNTIRVKILDEHVIIIFVFFFSICRCGRFEPVDLRGGGLRRHAAAGLGGALRHGARCLGVHQPHQGAAQCSLTLHSGWETICHGLVYNLLRNFNWTWHVTEYLVLKIVLLAFFKLSNYVKYL